MKARKFSPFKIVAILATILSLYGSRLMAQIHPLKIGDTVPNVELQHFVNYDKDSAAMADFKGKWLILDFWDIHCAPCIAAFPGTKKLENHLEQVLPGKVQFLWVTFVSGQDPTLRSILSDIYQLKGIRITSVTDDRVLNYLFKHSLNPHYVWIDPNGIVRAFTGEEAITETNIKDMVSGSIKSLPIKTY